MKNLLFVSFAACALSSYLVSAESDVAEVDFDGMDADDLAFFMDEGGHPRELRKKGGVRRPRAPRPKCVGSMKTSAGKDMCKAKGGRCVTSALVCKKLTRGRGFFAPSLCHDANPLTAPKDLCGCCIKPPRKRPRNVVLGEDVVLKFVGGAAIGSSSGGTISFSGGVEADDQLSLANFNMKTAMKGPIGDVISFASKQGKSFALKRGKVDGGLHYFNVEIDTYAHWKGLDSIKGLEPVKLVEEKSESDDGHFIVVPQTIDARISLLLAFSAEDAKSLTNFNDALSGAKTEGDLQIELSPSVKSHTIELLPTQTQEGLGVPRLSSSLESYQIGLSLGFVPTPKLELELEKIHRFWPPVILREQKRSLCIQPVRVRHRTCAHPMVFGFICFRWDYTYSGAGLAFGQPGANSQWRKVDVVFDWQPWKTIIDNAGKYREVTEAEMGDFKNEVADDDDCIEVFFAPRFNPSSTYGGGACWGSGTAGAQIVSSDEQVACGVDQTHLAHELGHALGLMHPGTGHATYADGSTGTLLCGSGWERDNPRRNSVDNGANIVNPLLINTWGIWNFFGPECTNSADCGSCSAHIPSDSC